MSIILGVFEEGLVYAIMALGVYITYKILDFPDLSVDGTFPLGGAVTVTLILAGVNPVLTLFAAFAAGVLAGCVTGFIHVKLKVRDLLSGIIVMTALYSVNLRVAGNPTSPSSTVTRSLKMVSSAVCFRTASVISSLLSFSPSL